MIELNNIYIALVHYPVKDKQANIITSAVTNFDIHDIARLSASIGFNKYYIITPIEEQKALVQRIVKHWLSDYGVVKNLARKQALEKVFVSSSLEQLKQEIEHNEKKSLKIISTSAKLYDNSISIKKFAEIYKKQRGVYLMLFGTAWGLADSIIKESDYILEPISYNRDFNHLSVRSAVSIISDRIYNSINNE